MKECHALCYYALWTCQGVPPHFLLVEIQQTHARGVEMFTLMNVDVDDCLR